MIRLLLSSLFNRPFRTFVIGNLLVFSAASASLGAQTASFLSATEQLESTFGFVNPQGVGLDGTGNLYIADSGNNAIEEMKLVGGLYQAPVALPSPSSGYNSPTGVAVTANGDVFVADTKNDAVEWIPAGCSSSACITQIAPGNFAHPEGVTVDASGNVFVADTWSQRVVEVLKSGNYTSPIIKVATGLNYPVGVAVDSSDDVFFADYGDSNVYEAALVSGSYQNPRVVGSGFNKPNGVSLDGAGNLYIVDTHNSAIEEIAASEISSPSPAITTIAGAASGISIPVGAAIDPSGNIFVGDFSGGTSGNGGVYEIMRASVNMGEVSLGQTSASLALQFEFTGASNTTIKAPAVLTGPAASGDFADAGNGTCTTANGAPNPYAPGSSCTIDVTFKPAQAGVSRGAAELMDASGNLLATAHLYGFGTGPEIVFNPGQQATQGSGFQTPAGLATDQEGNIYVADAGNNAVKMIAGGTSNTLAGGFSNPQDVAIDDAGNIFVADAGNNSIEEIVAADSTIKSLGGGFAFSGPKGVAVDSAGNVYVADTGNGEVEKIAAGDGYGTVTTLASGFTSPNAIAVDSSGDVFVVDSSSTPIREIVAIDGQIGTSPVIQAIGSGWAAPAAVAVDALDNLYVADAGDGQVVELPFNGSAYGSPIVLDSNFNSPAGIAVDWKGNVDLSDSSENQVLQLALSIPPSFGFATTKVGQTSADSPQSVSVANLGNATMTFSGLTFPSDFPRDPASTCTALITLAQNQSCRIGVDFVPTGASIPQEAVTLTDDALNAPGTNQQIVLSGAATYVSLDQPASTSLPGGFVGIAYGPVTFQASGGTGTGYSWSATGLPAGLTLDSSSGILSGTPTGVVPSGSIAVTATDTGTGSSGTQGSKVYQITIAPGTVILNWNPPADITYGSDLSGVLTATASVGSTVEPPSFGTASYTAALNPAGTANTVTSATVLPAGTYSLRLTYTPNDSTDYNTPAPIQTTLTVNGAQLTVSANSASRVYGTANPAFTGAVTGAVNGDNFSESFSTSATLTSNAGTYAIVPAISGSNLSNYSIVIQNGTLTVTQAGTTTALTAGNTSGTSVELSANVTSATTGAPTGTVSFYDGSTLLATSAISGGTASYSTSFASGSSHSFSAVYSGDIDFLTSTSASVSVTVPTLDFTMTASPGTIAILAGGTVSYTLALAPTSGIYPGEVSFQVNGLPGNATATFSPSSLAASAGAATVTLKVRTSSIFAAGNVPPRNRHNRLVVLSLLLLPLFGVGRLRRRFDRFRRLTAIVLVVASGFAAATALSGCGGHVQRNEQTYSLTVVAASGNVQHTSAVTLDVN